MASQFLSVTQVGDQFVLKGALTLENGAALKVLLDRMRDAKYSSDGHQDPFLGFITHVQGVHRNGSTPSRPHHPTVSGPTVMPETHHASRTYPAICAGWNLRQDRSA